MELDSQTWLFVAGPFIGLLVGLLSKLNASSGLKSTLNLLLSAAAGVFIQWSTDSGAHSLMEYVSAIFQTWVTSIAIFHGFWKPTKIAAAVQNGTASFGIGSPPELEVETPATEDGDPLGPTNDPRF